MRESVIYIWREEESYMNTSYLLRKTRQNAAGLNILIIVLDSLAINVHCPVDTTLLCNGYNM